MRSPSALFATAVVTVLGVLPGTPAAAADRPDLSVAFDAGSGVAHQGETIIRVTVANTGTVAATGVTLTVDVGSVDRERIRLSVPNTSPNCTLAGNRVTCTVQQLDPGASEPVFPLYLSAPRGATPGDAGAFVGTIAAAGGGDANPADNTARLPITVPVPDPEPRVAVADLNTAARPAGAGDRLPVWAAVRNNGFVPITELEISLHAPLGLAFPDRYRDCGHGGMFPGGGGDGFQYFPQDVQCHVTLTLQPGETLPLFDPATRRPLFTAQAGRNLSGPGEHEGFVSARNDPDPHRPDTGNGPSFAETVERLPIIAPGAEPAWWPEGLGDDGDFRVWSRPNTYDIAVTRPNVANNGPGQVSVDFGLVNGGPSDSGPVEYVITAPRGTVLLQPVTDSCYTQGTPGWLQEESAVIVCRTPDFPVTGASGTTPQARVAQLKLKSTPSGPGQIVVRGTGVGSKESRPRNNTVSFVVTEADFTGGSSGGGSGGGDGGLPITGANAALIAGIGGGVVVLGALLLIATGRRRRPESGDQP